MRERNDDARARADDRYTLSRTQQEAVDRLPGCSSAEMDAIAGQAASIESRIATRWAPARLTALHEEEEAETGHTFNVLRGVTRASLVLDDWHKAARQGLKPEEQLAYAFLWREESRQPPVPLLDEITNYRYRVETEALYLSALGVLQKQPTASTADYLEAVHQRAAQLRPTLRSTAACHEAFDTMAAQHRPMSVPDDNHCRQLMRPSSMTAAELETTARASVGFLAVAMVLQERIKEGAAPKPGAASFREYDRDHVLNDMRAEPLESWRQYSRFTMMTECLCSQLEAANQRREPIRTDLLAAMNARFERVGDLLDLADRGYNEDDVGLVGRAGRDMLRRDLSLCEEVRHKLVVPAVCEILSNPQREERAIVWPPIHGRELNNVEFWAAALLNDRRGGTYGYDHEEERLVPKGPDNSREMQESYKFSMAIAAACIGNGSFEDYERSNDGGASRRLSATFNTCRLVCSDILDEVAAERVTLFEKARHFGDVQAAHDAKMLRALPRIQQRLEEFARDPSVAERRLPKLDVRDDSNRNA